MSRVLKQDLSMIWGHGRPGHVATLLFGQNSSNQLNQKSMTKCALLSPRPNIKGISIPLPFKTIWNGFSSQYGADIVIYYPSQS